MQPFVFLEFSCLSKEDLCVLLFCCSKGEGEKPTFLNWSYFKVTFSSLPRFTTANNPLPSAAFINSDPIFFSAMESFDGSSDSQWLCLTVGLSSSDVLGSTE